MDEIGRMLQAAVRSHRAGDLASAGRLYADVLHREPGSADAWHLSGVIALQLGRVQQAIEQITYSLQLAPEMGDAWTNLAAAQLEIGETDAAEVSCRKCLALEPNHSRGEMLLGNMLRQRKQPHQALPHYRRSLELDADEADAWCNFGVALFECGNLEAGRDALNQALALSPLLVVAHINLGATLRRLGELPEAEWHLRTAIELSDGANSAAEAKVNLANVLRDRREFSEAAALAETVVRASPDHAKGWNLWGLSLQDQGRLRDAIVAFEKAADLAPEKFVSCLLYAVSLDDRSSEYVTSEHRRWAARLPRPSVPLPQRTMSGRPARLRIGLLSGDFCHHAIATFLLPLLTHLDQKHYPVHCFSERELPDEVTEKFRAVASQWTDTCGMNDADLAREIAAQQVDVLVDLAGHTARNRLAVMNWRAAPVQMTFLGYPNTTGLDSVDYYVTDHVRDASADEPQHSTNEIRIDSHPLYSEQLICLPHGANCYQAPDNAPGVNPTPALGVGALTFGSLHRLSKLNQEVLELWAKLLDAVPESRIVIVRDGLASPLLREELRHRLAAAGLDESRVTFQWKWQATHLEHYHSIDLLLPVFPWGGGTTVYESMWMGVPPLVTREGRPSGKAAVAALHRVGLQALVAETEVDLLELCRSFVQDPRRLDHIRQSLRSRMEQTVCNAAQFARDFAAACGAAWEHRAGRADGNSNSSQALHDASDSTSSECRR